MSTANTPAGKAEELGHKASEAVGERIALNAAALRLFKDEYRARLDRHSDALLVKDGLEAALIETANLRRELEEAKETFENVRASWEASAQSAIDLTAQLAETNRTKAAGALAATEEFDRLSHDRDALRLDVAALRAKVLQLEGWLAHR